MTGLPCIQPRHRTAAVCGTTAFYAVCVGEVEHVADHDEEAGAAGRAASEARAAAWLRKTADRIPTGWIITAGGAVLLGSTAAFGGLAAAPQPTPAELSVGEHYAGSQLDMAVVGASVGGEVRGTGFSPEPREGTLVVVLDVTNEFTAPRLARSKDTMGGVGVDGLTLEGVDVERTIDGSNVLNLQPGVPTRVRLAWLIDEGDVAPGDEIRVALPDSTHYVGSFVERGDYFTDVRVGAYVTVPVDSLPESDTP